MGDSGAWQASSAIGQSDERLDRGHGQTPRSRIDQGCLGCVILYWEPFLRGTSAQLACRGSGTHVVRRGRIGESCWSGEKNLPEEFSLRQGPQRSIRQCLRRQWPPRLYSGAWPWSYQQVKRPDRVLADDRLNEQYHYCPPKERITATGHGSHSSNPAPPSAKARDEWARAREG